MRSSRDELSGIPGIGHAVTEHHAADGGKRHALALYDALTGLPNRHLFFDRIASAREMGKRGGCYGGVILLDLDKFRRLNEQHGHAAGDLLLVEAAKRIKSCVRRVDAVARLDDDEFAVLLNALSEDRCVAIARARIVAQKIHQALCHSYLLQVSINGAVEPEAVECCCMASIGIAMFSGQERTTEDILKSADAAMCRAKNAGQNQMRVHGEE